MKMVMTWGWFMTLGLPHDFNMGLRPPTTPQPPNLVADSLAVFFWIVLAGIPHIPGCYFLLSPNGLNIYAADD